MSTSSIAETHPNYYSLVEVVKTEDYVPYPSRVNFVIDLINTIESNRQKYSSGYILCNENWIDNETAKFVPENVFVNFEQGQTFCIQQPQLPPGYASIKALKASQQEKVTEKEETQSVLINVSLILLRLFPNADTKHPKVWNVVKKIPWNDSLGMAKECLEHLSAQMAQKN